ncbi:MAG: phosphate transport system permease protein [Actinomycetota bacterium]|jgi:phosphate transport system permease protein|nr:phosphate transport system permease protein [Actinomycetota bacterium]
MSVAAARSAEPTSDIWKVRGRRAFVDRLATFAMYLAFLIAVIPLALVIWYTVGKGLLRFSYGFLTHSMAGVGPNDINGGVYHAIVGTIEQLLLASVISVPLGLLVAIYLNEYGTGSLRTIVRLLVDVMTGIPSIVAGLFVLAFWVLGLHKGYSGFAGGLALAILMLPVVTRSSEEMLKLVPDTLREAAYALGIPKWRVITSIVMPAARTGITTGIMLAVARVTGETAPLILTAAGTIFINTNPFHGQQEALPLFVFSSAQSGTPADLSRAWAGALTLILIVVLLYVVARLLTRRDALNRR